MSVGAASEETLGKIHELTAKAIQAMLESGDPDTIAQGLKLSVTFLDKNRITCVSNDVGAIGDLDKVLQRKRKRFGSDASSEIADFASERAKRAVNE